MSDEVKKMLAEAARLTKKARATCHHETVNISRYSGGHDPWPIYACQTCGKEIPYKTVEAKYR